jgi:PIN domain nuclease of toxin-antitoxin system
MAGQRYLLDTHCLIWFQENNPKIPKRIMELIQNTDNVILFSQVSLFEIAIKQKVGKLPGFHVSVEEVFAQAINDGFAFLHIENQHIYNYKNMPLQEEHRDPFDRLIIATAGEERAVILSSDEKFGLYNKQVRVIW